MATYLKYDHFIEAMWNKELDLFGTTDTVKAVIHTDLPVVATDDELADLTEITGTGYTAGGDDIQNDATRTGDTVTMTGVDVVWTASAADWTNTARYVTIHDSTAVTNILIAYWALATQQKEKTQNVTLVSVIC